MTRIAEQVYGGLTDADQRGWHAAAGTVWPGPGDRSTTSSATGAKLDGSSMRCRTAEFGQIIDPLADAPLLSVSTEQMKIAHEALPRGIAAAAWDWLEEDGDRAVPGGRRLPTSAGAASRTPTRGTPLTYLAWGGLGMA